MDEQNPINPIAPELPVAPVSTMPTPTPAAPAPAIAAPVMQPVSSPAPANFQPEPVAPVEQAPIPIMDQVLAQPTQFSAPEELETPPEKLAPATKEDIRGQLAELKGKETALYQELAEQAARGIPQDQLREYFTPQFSQIKQDMATLTNSLSKAVSAPVPTPQAPLLSPEEIDALAKPTEQQVKAELNTIVAPIQKQRAEALALDEIAKMREEADQRQELRQKELTEKFAQLDSKVRTQSFAEIFSGDSLGNKLLAGLSIALGGASQALTGAKSNPVIDFMNQMVEQQAQRDNLTRQEKDMLQKQVMEAGQQELRRLESATENAYRRDMIRMQQRGLDAKIGQINAQLMASLQQSLPNDMFSGRELTREEMLKARADKNLARQVVTLPNGKSFLATNANSASEFNKFATESLGALTNLEQYKDILESGNPFSLVDRGRAAALQQAIVGALRLPFTGPGVLTDTERGQLLKAIGDFGIIRLPYVEQAKVKQVMDSLKASTINKARLSGISGDIFPETFYKLSNEKAVKESDLVKAYKAKMPNLSEAQILKVIQTQIPKL